MTKAALLTLDGTQYLLSLASKAVHSLHSHYDQQRQMAVTAGDEDWEAKIVENLYDVELTLKELDPVYWKELVDKRLESTGGFTSWTATELARRAKLQTRINALLAIGRIPKAFWVVPEAVKLWRKRGAGGEDTEADAELDLLIFLSENRKRAELFCPVTV
ncbi:hypothetical protein M378DRAFT_19833 [Amanita muscaria Koide BX008]|uniref:Uncharacterized protein n=1 Tax=Amanita muscaria (strain Koide BX008) TaxID=946122 RepID=A0A0C2XPK5_AMAMK|nr:hypothetical protein M378DRAFT_19833 [Amanita muscaria Koide BX008]